MGELIVSARITIDARSGHSPAHWTIIAGEPAARMDAGEISLRIHAAFWDSGDRMLRGGQVRLELITMAAAEPGMTSRCRGPAAVPGEATRPGYRLTATSPARLAGDAERDRVGAGAGDQEPDHPTAHSRDDPVQYRPAYPGRWHR
jgi:hypothetical protein